MKNKNFIHMNFPKANNNEGTSFLIRLYDVSQFEVNLPNPLYADDLISPIKIANGFSKLDNPSETIKILADSVWIGMDITDFDSSCEDSGYELMDVKSRKLLVEVRNGILSKNPTYELAYGILMFVRSHGERNLGKGYVPDIRKFKVKLIEDITTVIVEQNDGVVKLSVMNVDTDKVNEVLGSKDKRGFTDRFKTLFINTNYEVKMVKYDFNGEFIGKISEKEHVTRAYYTFTEWEKRCLNLSDYDYTKNNRSKRVRLICIEQKGSEIYVRNIYSIRMR